MSKTMTRIVSLLLVLVMALGVCLAAVSCDTKEETKKPAADNTQPGDKHDPSKNYTYKSATTALGSNWNPHTWDTNADDSMLGYVSSPFVDMSIKDSENGVYQWVYEMATYVKDVTKDNQADLTKYPVNLPEGAVVSEITEGYVFEIGLNPNAKWENGEKITADDYVESFKRLLDSKMRNYRANLYYDGESAVAGGAEFYNSEAPIYANLIVYDGDTPVKAEDAAGKKLYINPTATNMTMASYSFYAICNDYGYIESALYNKIAEGVNAYGYIEITDANKADIVEMMDQYLSAFDMSIYNEDGSVNEAYYDEFLFYFTETYGDSYNYDDTVGMYKVDDYTIRYVNDTYIGFNYFMTSLTSTWLVYVPLYDQLKDATGELVTTTYGTSKETTMSYGTYRMESLEKGKQVVYVRNENWYGWEKDANGNLVSYTNFEVDGEKRMQYKTTKIVIDVMDENAMRQTFLKGELSDWAPSADELSKYSLSSQLYKVDETYTMSFFFNTNVNALKTMDASKGNVNSVVLSNETFRKAFSLAIDRAEFVTATQAYKPAFSLMNSLYYYDIYDDDKEDGVEGPETNYRNTDQAMQAIVNLYGVKYGEGEIYKTLKEAHDSINGYNLTEAKNLMKTACDELVAAGLYTKGADIKIKIGWAKGALTSDDNKQLALMNKYINAAVEGSGFGTITLEAVGNIPNRYDAVPQGEYAIGYGAWGGAAFYPFRNFQVYMDPDQYSINEAACYDPTTEELELTFVDADGKTVTDKMTWQKWSQSMMGTGKYATAKTATKLAITSALEEAFLKTYYRIPLCATTICSMLSYQVSYYTEDYNIMYGFGGMRLMSYNYDDEAWAKAVAEELEKNGGELDYQ